MTRNSSGCTANECLIPLQQTVSMNSVSLSHWPIEVCGTPYRVLKFKNERRHL
jgi:hypothetical protein